MMLSRYGMPWLVDLAGKLAFLRTKPPWNAGFGIAINFRL